MTENQTYLVIVPTYNEAENIERLIHEVLSQHDRISLLVVDDNSPDGTAALVDKASEKYGARLHLLKREGKLGLGSAYLEGFSYAMENGFDAAIQMDADFSHDPKYLLRFIELLPEYEMVIGSRYVSGGGIEGWTPWRRFLSQSGNLFARTVLRVPLRELTGGFNGYQMSLFRRINLSDIESKSYAFQTELKLLIYESDASWIEFPIIFTDREFGKSKIPRNQVFITLSKVLSWGFRRWLGLLPFVRPTALKRSPAKHS